MSEIINCPPVLFLLFNRPDLTQRVFERIRQAQPSKLFVAADGPCSDVPEDEALCAKARQVVEQVNWECEVYTLFRDTNLGCKQAVSSGIDWFFEHVKAGMILEDDCLPTMEFFPLCGELLVRYADDSRVGMISGNNYGFDLYDKTLSYSFSRHGHIWGWATWKRAWRQYQVVSSGLTAQEIALVKENISQHKLFADSWWKQAEASMNEKLNSWAYIWGVARYANNFLTIRPRVNMVANIGFGEESTHTKGRAHSKYVKTDRLDFPLVHPKIVAPDCIADQMLEEFRAPAQKKRPRMMHTVRRMARYILQRS